MITRALVYFCALLLVTSSTVGAQAAARPKPAGPSGWHAYHAVRGSTVLASHHAERRMTPASVLKLVVSAAALHHLGPDFRITTTIAYNGRLQDGVLTGDLVLRGAGDPTWNSRFFPKNSREPLEQLARRLKAEGLQQVRGDLVLDTSRFPGRPFPPSRAFAEVAYAFAAPTSALAVDENTIRLEIAPGRKVGAPGTARLLSESTSAIRLTSHLMTAPGELHGSGTVDILPVWQRQELILRGEYPITEPPYRIGVTVPQPDLHAAEALRQILRQHGIKISGKSRLATSPVPSNPLASWSSPPVAQLMPPILTESHNWYAEMLLRILAAELTDQGRIPHGLEVGRQFLIEEVGLREEHMSLDDGSGVSPYNLLTAGGVVQLLQYVWRQPWKEIFVDGLAKPGQGTLKAWSSLPPMAAKTGTLRNTLALAGFLRPENDDGEPVVFAYFVNHHGEKRPAVRAAIRHWLAHSIEPISSRPTKH